MEKHSWIYDKVFAVSVTGKCNYSCYYCSGRSYQNANLNILSSFSFIRRMGKNGWLIKITGGEPFLHPNTIDLANDLAAEGIDVLIQTNGFCLKSIESKLHPSIMILSTWHPSEIDFEKFYYYSERPNTEYAYILCPSDISSGYFNLYCRDYFPKFKLPLSIGFFEGMYNGIFYFKDDPIYAEFPIRKGFFSYEFSPCKNLFLTTTEELFKDYNFDCRIGKVSGFDLVTAESIVPLSYIECSSLRFKHFHNKQSNVLE